MLFGRFSNNATYLVIFRRNLLSISASAAPFSYLAVFGLARSSLSSSAFLIVSTHPFLRSSEVQFSTYSVPIDRCLAASLGVLCNRERR